MDKESIVKFAQNLVQTPSQAGIDDADAILEMACEFGCQLGVPLEIIKDDGKAVALISRIKGKNDGKTWCLNACIDTAPMGNEKVWDSDPFSGKVKDNFLHGRGAADSKIAVSMFMHIAKDLMAEKDQMHGDLVLIFDADEHTGNFGGIKAAIEQGYKPDGVMIGYPGMDNLIIGARGFSRYEVTLHGDAQHSGASDFPQNDTLLRLSDLISELNGNQPNDKNSNEFPHKPKLTITRVESGDGFAVTPSKATLFIDVRLTPSFNEHAADAFLSDALLKHDQKYDLPDTHASEMKKLSSEPAYVLEKSSELRMAISQAIKNVTGQSINEKVCNPSNIGCFLSRHGIDATAGYGVSYKGMHAANEQADLRDIDTVYNAYKTACMSLLKV